MRNTVAPRLALHFEYAPLAAEVAQFASTEWNGQVLRLVAVGGDPADRGSKGPMQATPHLRRCRRIRELLAQLRVPLGRVYLWRPSTGVASTPVDFPTELVDHVQVHASLSGSSVIRPGANGDVETLSAGEIRLIPATDSPGPYIETADASIHLVIETVGSSYFWKLAEADAPSRKVEPAEDLDIPLAFERVNYPVAMTPWEMEHRIARVAFALDDNADAAGRDALLTACETLLQDWRAIWACLGDSDEAMPAYRDLLVIFDEGLERLAGGLAMATGLDPVAALRRALVESALNPDLRPGHVAAAEKPAPPSPARRITGSRFERPVFIVAAPRSGSSLLFETLARSPTVWTVGGESHAEFEGIPRLHPINRNWDSNRLDDREATRDVETQLHAAFLRRLKNRAGERPPTDSSTFRLLEKTPKNALRVPFLARLFPDARFIYLYREPRGNISSIIEAWRSGRFVTYPQLPGWTGSPWSLVLIPGWRELIGTPIERIAAMQWRGINETVLADLAQLPDASWRAISYEEFTADPQGSAERLARFADIDWDLRLGDALPNSRHTLTPPAADKWRSNEALIESVIDLVGEVDRNCRAAMAAHRP